MDSITGRGAAGSSIGQTGQSSRNNTALSMLHQPGRPPSQVELLHPITHPTTRIPIDPRLLPANTRAKNTPGFLGNWPNNRLWDICFVDDESQIPRREHQIVMIDNEIHPLWHYKKWRRFFFSEDHGPWKYVSPRMCDDPSWLLPQVIYHRMVPALRLATLILQQSLPFLAAIIRCPVEDGLGRSDADEILFDQDWSPDETDFAVLDKELELHASQHRIFCRPAARLNDMVTLGTSEIVYNSDFIETAQNAGSPDRYLMIVTIAQEMMHQFKDENWIGKPSIARARVYGVLAQTLVHELCHGLWRRRAQFSEQIKKRPGALFFDIPEPRMFPNMFNELGHISTRWMFGCEFLMATLWEFNLIDPVENLWNAVPHLNWDGLLPLQGSYLIQDNDPNADRQYRVPRRTIEDLFDKRTWQGGKITIYLEREPVSIPFPPDLLRDGKLISLPTGSS